MKCINLTNIQVSSMKINFNLQPKSPLLTEIKSPSTLEDSLKAKAIHHKFKFTVQTPKCW